MPRSTIHSRLLHQAGKWTCLSKTQMHLLHTRYMAPLRRILSQPPEPGTHRMRDDEILQTLNVQPLEAQLVADKLRLANQIATSQQALSMVVSSTGIGVAGGIGASIGVSGGGHEGQACEPSPTSCFAPHLGEFWHNWPGQWATLLRMFLARTAAAVTVFGKKAQGKVYAPDGCERDQEWLCMQCGKWFPSRAACIGHQVFMVGIQREDWLRARNAQFVGLSSVCGNDCGDTCGLAHAVACKQRVREWCQRSQKRMLSALTQPMRSREKGVRRQGLAGCGVRRVNVPNDAWILDALMTAMSSALLRCQLTRWCDDLGDFEWTASAAFSGRWWNGARDDPSSFRKGLVWLFWPRACCTISRRAWLGCAPDAVSFNGLTIRPFPFFTSSVGRSELSGGCLLCACTTEQTAMSTLCHHHHHLDSSSCVTSILWCSSHRALLTTMNSLGPFELKISKIL